MNHRELLKKYIDHVATCEGTTFLIDYYRTYHVSGPKFTDEEWAELKRLYAESLDEDLDRLK